MRLSFITFSVMTVNEIYFNVFIVYSTLIIYLLSEFNVPYSYDIKVLLRVGKFSVNMMNPRIILKKVFLYEMNWCK